MTIHLYILSIFFILFEGKKREIYGMECLYYYNELIFSAVIEICT